MLTERDRLLVHWVGRLGVARTADLMTRFGLGRTVAYRRVKELVDHGLLERHRVLHAEDGLLTATAGGLQYVGLGRLPKARVSLPQIQHSVECAKLAAQIELSLTTQLLLTDREHRAAEAMHGALASAKLGSHPDGGQRLHRPDLVLVDGAGTRRMIAIEVELTSKTHARLRAILRGYMRNQRLSAVRYYAPPRVAGLVQKVATAVGADEVVQLYDIASAP